MLWFLFPPWKYLNPSQGVKPQNVENQDPCISQLIQKDMCKNQEWVEYQTKEMKHFSWESTFFGNKRMSYWGRRRQRHHEFLCKSHKVVSNRSKGHPCSLNSPQLRSWQKLIEPFLNTQALNISFKNSLQGVEDCNKPTSGYLMDATSLSISMRHLCWTWE